MSQKLNKIYKRYENDEVSRKQLHEEMWNFAYTIIRKKMHVDEDEGHELFMVFYTSMEQILNRYNPDQKDFQSYIIMTLNFRLKNLRRTSVKNLVQRITAQTVTQQETSGITYPEETAEPCHDFESNRGEMPFIETRNGKIIELHPKMNDRNKRRMLILLIKQSCRLSALEIERFCTLFGINHRKAEHFIYLTQQITYERRERHRRFCEARNKRYNRLQILRHRFINEEDTHHQEHIRRRISREEQLLKSLNERIRRARLEPSNREVATLLEMPKGTVDSIFYHLSNATLYFIR